MAFLPRLRHILMRTGPESSVPPRRWAARRSSARESELRSALAADPNDQEAFSLLAELVRRRAAESYLAEHDPLRAPGEAQERERAANLAVWSLAEELAGNPKAWYPLVELARLSIEDDHEGAMRRLATAAERDSTGLALSSGMALLRTTGQPGEALNLGVGHARVREHIPSVGAELVHAALAVGRLDEAQIHLVALVDHHDQAAVAQLLPALEKALEVQLQVPEV